MSLIKQETTYSKAIDYDIYCGDPEFADKPLDVALEEQGLVMVRHAQKLSPKATCPCLP